MTITAPHDARPADGVPLQMVHRPRAPLDLHATVAGLQRGPGDPTQQRAGGVIWRATRTPAGVATVALRQQADGSVRAAAWGDGREWALAQVPALCGALDDASGFDASRHPLIDAAHRRHPGMRLARTDQVFDAFAQAVIEQKVTLRQAFGAWRRLVTWCGEGAPGPTPRPMFAPPAPPTWHRIPSWTWHRAGLEPPQAQTLTRAAARPDAVDRAARADGAALTALPGVGAWTTAETRIRALGDPDAVSVGDFHLAHHVGYALTGTRTDDAGMLELLEPWHGHRQRVIRLIYAAGAVEPRRAPRLHIEDHRDR
ncbi:DNA-3-methyladenine glycosylase [Microbacterium sp. G2-8]|uniref:DNA-3-methyladenine glycosylase family protein n=1 Tax=Microbacterium sp. G2-8 TaxID=2842454 RepID=UPI001C8A6A59|nr:DNA-3-methyladenine glycosylase 2 family protein [Microbacterium sp. G2-8]